MTAVAWKFRRSFTILPGIRLNLGKTGHSWTFGSGAFKTTVNPKRRTTTRTVRTPIKGLFFTKTTKRK